MYTQGMPPRTRSKYKRQRQNKLLFSELPVDIVVYVLSFCTLDFRRVHLLREQVSRTKFILWEHVTAYLGYHQMPFSQVRQYHLDHYPSWLPMAARPSMETRQIRRRMINFMSREFQEIFGPDWRMGFLKFGATTAGLKAQFFIWRKVTHPVLIEIRSENHFRADYARVFEMRAEGVFERCIEEEDSSPAFPIAARLFAVMTDDGGMFYC
jgi:hypothetical protein